YYTRQEVRDLTAVLWSIEDPLDGLSLVASLRSPLFGFSDEEIFLYTRAGGKLDYLAPASSGAESFADFREAFALLSELHRERNRRGPVGTIHELMRRTGYGPLLKLWGEGKSRTLNIRKAVQQARIFEEKSFSYRSFAAWLKNQDRRDAPEGEISGLEEGNAVRMITIHKSKGLQFPVVILVNLAQRRSGEKGPVRGGKGELSFRHGNGGRSGRGGWETSDYREVRGREGQKEDAEAIRLLYVAATRAGDQLVIPRAPGKRNYYELFSAFLASGPGTGVRDEGEGGGKEGEDEFEMVTPVRAADLPPLSGSSEPFPGLPRITPGRLKRGEEIKGQWRQEREELLRRGMRAPVIVTSSGLEERFPAIIPEPAGRSGDQGPGLREGSAFHRIMELVKLEEGEEVDHLCRSVAAEYDLVGREEELIRLVKGTLSPRFLESLRGAERVLREVPFTLPLKGSGGGRGNEPGAPPGYLEGRVDLLFQKGGCWTVVDYKTDHVGPGSIDDRYERYRIQGGVYAAALDRLGIKPAGGVVFYFVRVGETRRLEVTPALLRETWERIRSAAEAGA
nr:PD-(D/E)XK nuclease family protein [Candidatus Krumholzibacteriota bacterium]